MTASFVDSQLPDHEANVQEDMVTFKKEAVQPSRKEIYTRLENADDHMQQLRCKTTQQRPRQSQSGIESCHPGSIGQKKIQMNGTHPQLEPLPSLRTPIRILMTPTHILRPSTIIITTPPTRHHLIKPASAHIRAARPPQPIRPAHAPVVLVEQTQLPFIWADRGEILAQPGPKVGEVVALVRHAVDVGAGRVEEVGRGADVDVAGGGVGLCDWWWRGRCGLGWVDPGGPRDGGGVEDGLDEGGGIEYCWGGGRRVGRAVLLGVGGCEGCEKEEERQCGSLER